MEDCTNNRQTHFRAIRQRCQLSPSPICTIKEERKYTNTHKYKIRNYAYTKYIFQILGNKAILKIITLANLHKMERKYTYTHKKNKINKDIHTQVQNTEPRFWGKKAALPIITLPNLHQQGRKEIHKYT